MDMLVQQTHNKAWDLGVEYRYTGNHRALLSQLTVNRFEIGRAAEKDQHQGHSNDFGAP